MDVNNILKLSNKFIKFAAEDYLWHGSVQRIEKLEPRKAVDIGGNPYSNKKAIYATDLKKFAIMMTLASKGSDTGMFWDKNSPQMVLYQGKIRSGEKLYLHKLPRKNESGKDMFNSSNVKHEFYSKPWVKEIVPIKIIELNVDDYDHLIREANNEDWRKREKYLKNNK